jgi:hypothetical protein
VAKTIWVRGLHVSAGLTNDLDCVPQPEIVAQQHYFIHLSLNAMSVTISK